MNDTQGHLEEETSKSITGDGVRIHYNDMGDSQDVIIMLHGSGPGATGWSNFNRNVDALSTRHRVICVDLPGWGKSEPRAKGVELLSWYTEKLITFMDQLDIPKASFIGNSLGGSIALKLTIENPERVKKLVMMGCPAGFRLFGEARTPAITDILTFYDGDGPSMERLRSFSDKFVFDQSHITDELLNMRLKAALTPSIVENPPMRFGQGDSVEPLWRHPSLGVLPHDVLLIWGREDKVIPLDIGMTLLSIIPKAQLHVFPQCGHWAQWEHADRFNTLVCNFLD